MSRRYTFAERVEIVFPLIEATSFGLISDVISVPLLILARLLVLGTTSYYPLLLLYQTLWQKPYEMFGHIVQGLPGIWPILVNVKRNFLRTSTRFSQILRWFSLLHKPLAKIAYFASCSRTRVAIWPFNQPNVVDLARYGLLAIDWLTFTLTDQCAPKGLEKVRTTTSRARLGLVRLNSAASQAMTTLRPFHLQAKRRPRLPGPRIVRTLALQNPNLGM